MINNYLLQVFKNLNYLYSSDIRKEEIEKDVKRFFDAYTIEYMGKLNDFSDYLVVKRKMEKTRDEYTHLLEVIKKSVDTILKTIDKNIIDLKDISDFRKKYPDYVSIQDPTEAIEFYDNIDKEDPSDLGINITKSSKFIGVTRQTLSTWRKNEFKGFKRRQDQKVSKKELYYYFLSTLKRKVQ
jgi:hypothetical protein